MSSWGDYGRAGRAAANAAEATTLKSCLKDWGEVFRSLWETSRNDWIVTRLFEKVEPFLNKVGEAVAVDGLGSGLKVMAKAAIWVVGISNKEPREKIKQAANSTVAIVRKATKKFVGKVKEIRSKTLSVVSHGILTAWSAARSVVARAVKTVGSGIKFARGIIKTWF